MKKILLLSLLSLLFACKKHQDQPAIPKEITSFVLKASDNPGVIAADVSATIDGDTIRLSLSESVPLSHLVPAIQHNGKSISPQSGVAQDFTSPVHYTVSGRDGSPHSYTVVARSLSAGKQIISFLIKATDNPAISTDITGVISNDTIYLNTLTDAALKPTITYTGKRITPVTGIEQQFNDPVPYTVTAEDGTFRTYTVISRKNARLYFGSTDGYVYALDATTGVLAWKYKTGAAVNSSPTLYNGKLYFMGTDNYLYCLNADTGDFIWYVYIRDGGASTCPFVQDGVVYTSAMFYLATWSSLRAFDANTGSVLWNSEPMKNADFIASPVVAGNLLFIGTISGGGMYALNKTNGDIVWRSDAGMVSGSAVVTNDNLYFVSEAVTLTVLDRATGTFKGSYGVGTISTGELTLDNGTIYISNLNELLAIDSATLTLKWKLAPFPDGVNTNRFSPPVVENGFVYAGNGSGEVYTVDANSGSVKWTASGGGNTSVSHGIVYCGTHDGALNAYNAKTGAIKWSFKTGAPVYSGPCVTDINNVVAYPGVSGHRN